MELEGNELKDTEGNVFKLEDILSIRFIPDFDRNSRIIFSLRNKEKEVAYYIQFWSLLLSLLIGIPVLFYTARFTIILTIYILIVLFLLQFPKYSKIYSIKALEGVKVYEMEEIDKFMLLQKAIWQVPRGRLIIKRGFVLGVRIEKIAYSFLPRSIYNSDKARDIIKFMKKVIYPIIVIIIPFCIASCSFFVYFFKRLITSVTNDMILVFFYENADDAWLFFIEHIQNYPRLLLLAKKVEELVLIGFAFLDGIYEELRTDKLLLFMRLDYLSHCYDAVFTHLKSFSNALGSITDKVGITHFSKAHEAVENASNWGKMPSSKTGYKAYREIKNLKTQFKEEKYIYKNKKE